MKKSFWYLSFLMFLLLAGCGSQDGKENGQPAQEQTADASTQTEISGLAPSQIEGLYEIQYEQVELPFSLKDDERLLGLQYLDGEKIQLFGMVEDGSAEGSVYLRREGAVDELLLEGVSEPYMARGSTWYTDGERYYIGQNRFFIVLDNEGKLDYRLSVDGYIQRICRTKSGEIVLATQEETNSILEVLDAETGEILHKAVVNDFFAVTEGIESDVLVFGGAGIYDLNLETGEKLSYISWEGTSYSPRTHGQIREFKLLSEDAAELLVEKDGGKQFLTASLSKVSLADLGRTILTYRITYVTEELKILTAQFNQENEEYYVRLENRGDMDYDDFATRNAIEIATGKGPDMISSHAVKDAYSLAKKGALEDLEPYITAGGMDREDYFPAAFQSLGMESGTYGLCCAVQSEMIYMSEDVVGDGRNLSCEELLRRMQDYQGEVVYNKLYQQRAYGVLYRLLGMSDDFYGMVDWEKGTCSFSGKLWESAMEVAKRYGLTDEKKDYEDIAYINIGASFRFYAENDNEARSGGFIPVGYPGEDGMVLRINAVEEICMNAASEHKEGVWQYMQYLLEQQNQVKLCGVYAFPVNRGAYEQLKHQEMEMAETIAEGMEATAGIPTEEQLAYLESIMTEGQKAPSRTEPIWDIIYEETAMYFSGEKTIEEVSQIIDSRVRLYLAEQTD
ncbi:MAG: extracellular solute-binding protein [Lachnospiraceae bacterium]